MNRPLPEDARISQIVHAEIIENPFSHSDENGAFFALTVRIETTGGSRHLYGAKVFMAPNPFQARQFFFAPNARR